MNTRYESPVASASPSVNPLFVAGYLSALTGVLALMITLGVTTFTFLIFVLITVGLGLSWLVTMNVIPRWIKDASLGIFILGSIFGFSILPGPQNMLLNPTRVQYNDPSVAGVLAWAIAVYSFNLSTPKTILFMCVPLLSMTGLLATFGANAGIVVCFIIFTGLTVYILIQERILDAYNGGTGETSRLPQSPYTSRRVGMAAAITVLALSAGYLIGTILYSTVDRYVMPGLAVFRMASLMQQFTSRDYPQVASGPAPQDNTEVFTIETSEGRLWRGQTYDVYTGKGWQSTDFGPGTGLRATLVSSDAQAGERVFRTDIPPDPIEGGRAHTRKLEQDIRMISGHSEVLFAAAEPTSILSRGRRTFMIDSSRIQSRFIYGFDSVLKVTSEISDATPDELRSAPTDYPGEIKARYLTVPESCWQVEPLTRKVTAGKKSPYEKAEAIRDYLSQNFQYDLNTPATPAGEDPVPYFLFNEKRGYCDVFSSSMTVMCRQAGIPARWVTGFGTGELDSKDGRFHVRIKDYHAWVEVYFPGYGWIEFDPTPGGGGGGVTKSKLMASLTKLMLRVQYDWPRLLIGLVIILLLAYLLKTEVWDRRLRFGRLGGTVVVRPSPADDTYRMMCAVLAKFGFKRHPSATPSEYASDLNDRMPQELSHLAGAVKIITSDFEEARYSDRQVPPDRVERGVATLKALRAGLRDARKQRLLPTGNRK